ncbi:MULTISPECIES: hypothetical protein [Acidobacterium]|nr:MULTISPECIES: hypothetical protein [Acidobacterium]HCT59253.1 hypothetical protein [Acidobacterium sp.]
MKSGSSKAFTQAMSHARKSAVFALLLGVVCVGSSAVARAQASAPAQPEQKSIHLIFLPNAASRNDTAYVYDAVRNMFPHDLIYMVPSEYTIIMRSTEQDYEMARQMVDKLSQARRVFRLTYTLVRSGSGAASGQKKLTLTVAVGNHASLKQGAKVPMITGSYTTSSGGSQSVSNNQWQYIDTGINIFADLNGTASSLILHSKVEESGAEQVPPPASGSALVLLHTTLDSTTLLTPGKPQVIGSLALPGSGEHEQIEVTAQPVQ